MMERWSDGERDFLDRGRRGVEVSFPEDAEIVCRKCHRMISNVMRGDRHIVHCVRTVGGIVSGKERVPSYCPMGYLVLKGGEKR